MSLGILLFTSERSSGSVDAQNACWPVMMSELLCKGLTHDLLVCFDW